MEGGDKLLEWLESIGKFISLIGTFLVSFFMNVIEVITLVAKGVSFAWTAINYLPIQYQAVMIAIIAFCVIITIIHFGG